MESDQCEEVPEQGEFLLSPTAVCFVKRSVWVFSFRAWDIWALCQGAKQSGHTKCKQAPLLP